MYLSYVLVVFHYYKFKYLEKITLLIFLNIFLVLNCYQNEKKIILRWFFYVSTYIFIYNFTISWLKK